MFHRWCYAGCLWILDIVAQRINLHLFHRVKWISFEEIMGLVVSEKEAYPKPDL